MRRQVFRGLVLALALTVTIAGPLATATAGQATPPTLIVTNGDPPGQEIVRELLRLALDSNHTWKPTAARACSEGRVKGLVAVSSFWGDNAGISTSWFNPGTQFPGGYAEAGRSVGRYELRALAGDALVLAHLSQSFLDDRIEVYLRNLDTGWVSNSVVLSQFRWMYGPPMAYAVVDRSGRYLFEIREHDDDGDFSGWIDDPKQVAVLVAMQGPWPSCTPSCGRPFDQCPV